MARHDTHGETNIMSDWREERQAVCDALAIENFIDRRAALRRAFEKVFASLGSKAEEIARMIVENSPLVGDETGKVKVRPTTAGLRDQLHERALANVGAAMPESVSRMKKALLHPGASGVVSPRAKCGYEFGVHRDMKTLDELREWLKEEGFEPAGKTREEKAGVKVKSTLKTESKTRIDVSGWGLGALVQAWFLAKQEVGGTDGLVTKAMKQCVRLDNDQRVEAVHAYIETLDAADRGKAADWAMAASKVQELARNMIALLMGGEGEGKGDESMGVTELGLPDEKHADLIDLALERSGLPGIREIIKRVNEGAKEKASLMKAIEEAKAEAKRAIEEASRKAAAMPVSMKVEASGEVPNGSFKMVKASEAFGLEKGKEMFDFDVPVWSWDGEHPLVPEKKQGYVFRPHELFALLMGIVGRAPTYLHGHTGTGKTTMVEQVAAYLGYPFMRLNFDSDISRMDLIGRDTLVTEDGVTISKFVDGILPQMMQAPVLGCFDEIDYVRSDIGYVMQRVFEMDNLVLTEDGGRIVKPHPMFRIFATGNTVGQGDEHGMYQGARPQSLALLDRFTNWIEVKYLDPEDREKLVRGAAPGLEDRMVRMICAYITEHLTAFTGSKVLQPLSPRGYMALAERVATYTSLYPEAMKKQAVMRAFESAVLARASMQDRVVLAGIVERLVK
jgi:cobaltochelatase CobS